MKKHICFLVAFSIVIVSTGFSQEKNSKIIKEEKTTQKKGRIEQLVNSQNFEFVGRTAFPLGSSPVELSSNPNSVTFTPDLIFSDMPYYGTGYAGMALGRDAGMSFQGKPEKFTIERKAKGFEISAVVKSKDDTKTLSLSVSESGSAMLTISSNDRSTISYQGEIRPIKK